MKSEHLYTQDEVIQILVNLVNGIGQLAMGDIMPKRYKEQVTVDGQKRWVTGRTLQELLEGYLELCLDAGIVQPALCVSGQNERNKEVIFGEYLNDFVETYKSKQESLTKINRSRIIKTHILPKWGSCEISSIKPVDLQKWFNQLEEAGYSHETLIKIKNTMSPVMDAAVEEDILRKNPLKSSLLVIGGRATVSHKAIPKEKMQEIRERLGDISDSRVRIMTALLSYTGMRFEEILGLRWEDIDFSGGWIYIQRAVVHPTRNQPEVKEPKSKSSKRRIPLPSQLKILMLPRYLSGYVLFSAKDSKRETPLSYSEARRVMDKLSRKFNLEGYSAHDFRDTCATEWREKGIPLDVISSLLGHAKVEVTQKRYVKYRDEIFQGVRDIYEDEKEQETDKITRDEVS